MACEVVAMPVRMEEHSGSVRFAVRAQPRAARSEVVGEHDGALKVRLAAPPVDGEANRELVKLLARRLGVSQSCVRVVAGESGRNKLVEVAGVPVAGIRSALGI
jgi:uncharacterized protein (TIGR00251 family)